ncbi:SH3 domain (SH3b1 type) [Hathewaya proteolytica DSM 3090]|uniref:SH3 domain (SH3b1 type) n=1 Tax=Hathewaya proteolytica DSM 3090 TaxID=1121331 RepID=A0A1M6N733_9CLOT|nr:NlpC/P60 family protein [Hathewaya proteolytica]SHJ91356.1 SH3 domain (SH3b1 type) [Hathewaya proteolytica DSM 3090]
MIKLKSNKHKKIIFIICIFAILLSFLVVYLLFYHKKPVKVSKITATPNRASPKNDIINYFAEIKPLSIEKPVKSNNHDSYLKDNDYWTNLLSDKNKLIMTKDQIGIFNKNNTDNIESLYDLDEFPHTLSSNTVLNYINKYTFPNSTMYDESNNTIETSTYNKIKENMSLTSMPSTMDIKYGITLTRTSLKRFPSEIQADYRKPIIHDRFQETAIDSCEKIIILHESKDKKWSFIIAYNYMGWVKNKDICVSDLNSINYFANPKDFIMILQNAAELTKEGMQYKYFMGTKLPIEYTMGDKNKPLVYIPVVDDKGKLCKKPVTLSKDLDYSIGYLDYTRENVIKQAFKQLGTPYCWGDANNGRDCSSFIASTFKTMGIYLPRNTDEQELVNFKSINLRDLSAKDKTKKISTLKPGDILFIDGHVVMYLGDYNNSKYIIHNSPLNTSCTAVSRYDIAIKNNITYIDLYTKCTILE